MEIDDIEPGFHKIPVYKICTDPQHNPPMGLYIPPGYFYVHKCPSCGNKIMMGGNIITCNSSQIGNR